LFQVFTFGFSGLFIGLILFRTYSSGEVNYEFVWTDVLILLTVGLLLWLNFGTEYELSQTELKYKSGPIQGKIEIERIKEIIKGKSMWCGLKLATARNGLIINYISPETNDTFIEKILELNKDIKIIAD